MIKPLLCVIFLLTIYLAWWIMEELSNFRKVHEREERWFIEDLQKWLDEQKKDED